MDVRSFAPRPILRLLTYRFAPVPTLYDGSDIVYSSCSALSVCYCYCNEYTGDFAGCQAFWDEKNQLECLTQLPHSKYTHLNKQEDKRVHHGLCPIRS